MSNKKENKDIVIPGHISDKKAYLQWLKGKEQLENHKDRIYETSDGQKLDMFTLIHHLRKRIEHLPEEEKKEIEERRKAFGTEIGRLVSLEKKSRGTNGRYSIEGILDHRRTELLELFGSLHSTQEVHKIVTEDWGLDVSLNTVKVFEIKHKLKIDQLQKKYEEEFNTLGITKKRARLDKLNYLLHVQMQEFDKAVGINKVNYSREIRGILDQAKKEVDGNEVRLKIDGSIDVNMTIQGSKELKQLLSEISINQLIIARVAARNNVSPLQLAHQLMHGYYSKFNGFRRNDNILSDKPEPISGFVYDWNEIEKNYNDQEEKRKQREKLDNIEDAKIISEVRTSKDKLVEAIKKRQDRLNDTKTKLTR